MTFINTLQKKISVSGEYQQTPFMQTHSAGYFPFGFFDKNSVLTNCKLTLEKTADENEITAFLMRPELNMTDKFRRDLVQFISELVFNLFEHNFSKSVGISVTNNKIEITDDSQHSFNPFEAKISINGYGVIAYHRFFERYAGTFVGIYSPGHPNLITLEFDDSIFAANQDNPCYIELPDFRPLLTKDLNKYDLDNTCEEIVFDISKTATPLSLYRTLFDYLLARTKEKKPLIILKMHKDDMLREDVKRIIQLKHPSERIMLV